MMSPLVQSLILFEVRDGLEYQFVLVHKGAGLSSHQPLQLLFLNQRDLDSIVLSMDEVLGAVEEGLRQHGLKRVVLPPKSHLDLEERYRGHFNILKGYVASIEVAGIKVVGDYVLNYRHQLPSEIGLLTLYHPETGMPFAIVEGTKTTWMRTGAVTAIGAKYLARRDSKVIAHIGARGTARYNILMLSHLFSIEEIRVISKRAESRDRLVKDLREEHRLPVRGVDSYQEAVKGADIIIDSSRLETPEVLIHRDWLKPGSLLIPYGWVMSIDPQIPFIVDKLVVDDWKQCCEGGQLYPVISSGQLTERHLYGEIGEIVCGHKRGRETPEERILFWHRGFAISDIMLGYFYYQRAREKGLGQSLEIFGQEE
jgi:ornithine cyclodeaminase